MRVRIVIFEAVKWVAFHITYNVQRLAVRPSIVRRRVVGILSMCVLCIADRLKRMYAARREAFMKWSEVKLGMCIAFWRRKRNDI